MMLDNKMRLSSILVLCAIMFFTSSCFGPPEEHTPEFFMRQSRDQQLVGTWVHRSQDSEGNSDERTERTFHANGELLVTSYNQDNKITRKKRRYWYTKGNVLYILTPGQGLKLANWVDEWTYKIENGTDLLIKTPESTSWDESLGTLIQ